MLPLDEKERVRQAYVRQVRLQVILPLGIGALLVAGLAGLAGTAHGAPVGAWADVALVALLIPIMLVGLILLAVTLAVAVLVGRLIPRIPEPAAKLRLHWHHYSRMAERAVDSVAAPMIRGGALAHSAATVVRRLRGAWRWTSGGRDGD